MCCDTLVDVNSFWNISNEILSFLNTLSFKHISKGNFPFKNFSKDALDEMKEAYFYYKFYVKNDVILQHYKHKYYTIYKTYHNAVFDRHSKVYERCKKENLETYCNIFKINDLNFFGEKIKSLICGKQKIPYIVKHHVIMISICVFLRNFLIMHMCINL